MVKCLLLLSTSSGSVDVAAAAVPPAASRGLVVVLRLRAGLAPGAACRPLLQAEEAVVRRVGGGEERVLLGDHARLLVVGRVSLAQHQAASGWSPVGENTLANLLAYFSLSFSAFLVSSVCL